MRKWILALALALAACATTPRGTLVAAADVTAAYTSVVNQSLLRGRITGAQAQRELERIEKIRLVINDGWVALGACPDKTNCAGYMATIQQLQPMLLELERKLREEEAKR